MTALAAPPERAGLTFRLHPQQSRAYGSRATEILYGGAAGGGKSHLIRVKALTFAAAIPGLQVYIFRRTNPDLQKNHMEGPTGFPALLAPWIESGRASINYSKNFIALWNGSKIHLCHCQYEKDVYSYQGAEIHLLLPDELTHFSRKQYAFLRSRVRLGGLEVPPAYQGLLPCILAGANPGGVGHNWVKATFVDPAPPMKVWRAPEDEGGMLRQYIPAKLADNPTLQENDPQYAARLHGLGDPALVRAMLEGDWDIVAGGMLDDVWRTAVHVLPAVPLGGDLGIPKGWRVDRAFDWGSSKPFSVGWWAESNGEPWRVRARTPDGGTAERLYGRVRGDLIRVAEWYGWDGKTPNTGIRMSAERIAEGIVQRETALGIRGRVVAGPADSAIFVAEPGRTSIGDVMRAKGATFTEADKKPGSRKSGWEAVRARLLAAQADPPESPGVYVFDTCRQSIRTLPTLPRDERDPDDVDTDAEDHIADEWRYRIMAPKRTATTGTFTISR